jgi:site-specific DNA recombinase
VLTVATGSLGLIVHRPEVLVRDHSRIILGKTVWSAVSGALQSPETLLDGHRSLLETSNSASALENERNQVKLELKQTQAQEDRSTQAYVTEAMDLTRYKLEMDRLRARSKGLEGFSHDLDQRSDYERDSKSALRHLESFCHRVADRLVNMSFEERQELLWLVVDRINVENGTARIDTVNPILKDDGQLHARRSELVEPQRCGGLGPFRQ